MILPNVLAGKEACQVDIEVKRAVIGVHFCLPLTLPSQREPDIFFLCAEGKMASSQDTTLPWPPQSF